MRRIAAGPGLPWLVAQAGLAGWMMPAWAISEPAAPVAPAPPTEASAPVVAPNPSGPTTAGLVKRASGAAWLRRAGESGQTALAAGQAMHRGDAIVTGAEGRVALTLSDDTLLSVGPNSELVLSEYHFDGRARDGGMLISLWRGTVAVVTGLLARHQPDKVRLQTRQVTLGVRGTEFIVDAGSAGSP